ncbi:MAG: hypothetical protein JWN70_2341 [Planctomycetaceae bacterium]|nr:hypothetical protein [Planctomycetaceae bacterium]
MTTLISKILAVFVTIASVAFMAIVMANVSAGGPNWTAKSKELTEVAFDRANPQAPYTAKKRSDGTDLGGGPILPAAIVSAQKKLLEAERTQQADLDTKIAARKSAITESKALIDVDLDAMKRREADLDKQFADLMEQMNQLSQNFTMESKKQTDDLAVLKLRSQEYILIKNQLEELKAQREVATEELGRLKALVYQAKANLERAQTRLNLLKDDGLKVDYNDAPKPVGKPAGNAKPGDEEPAAAKPAEKKPADEKPPEAKPDTEKAAEEKPAAEKPAKPESPEPEKKEPE